MTKVTSYIRQNLIIDSKTQKSLIDLKRDYVKTRNPFKKAAIADSQWFLYEELAAMQKDKQLRWFLEMREDSILRRQEKLPVIKQVFQIAKLINRVSYKVESGFAALNKTFKNLSSFSKK